MQQHILITGGNGFVGKQICKLASEQLIPVVSISRSGKPEGINESDYKIVTWVAADVFEPESWKQHLINCKAIVHSIGIIEERLAEGFTYEKMIFVSAKTVGIAAKAAGIKRFIYISASAGAPETPHAYMQNKEAAENFLYKLGLDLAILKPAMIYGVEKPETIQKNEIIQNLLKDPQIGPEISPNRPLPVESVAKVALAASVNNSITGKLCVDDIEKIASVIKIFL